MEKVMTMADLNISKNPPEEEGGKKSIVAQANAQWWTTKWAHKVLWKTPIPNFFWMRILKKKKKRKK